MLAQPAKSGSLHRISTQNALQRYLLDKNKKQKASPTHCKIRINKKQRDSPLTCLEQEQNQQKSGRLVNLQPKTLDFSGQLEAIKDRQTPKRDISKQSNPQNKWKSNRSLLNLLLNSFHQQRRKNQTLPDSQSIASQTFTPQSRSIHRLRGLKQVMRDNKQRCKGMLTKVNKHLFQADSFHVQSMNTDSQEQEELNKTKEILCENTDNTEVQVKPRKEKSALMLMQHQRKHFTYLFQKPTRLTEESHIFNIRRIQKENNRQRISENPKRIFMNTYCNRKEDESVDPWSTNYIKGESQDLCASQKPQGWMKKT